MFIAFLFLLAVAPIYSMQRRPPARTISAHSVPQRGYKIFNGIGYAASPKLIASFEAACNNPKPTPQKNSPSVSCSERIDRRESSTSSDVDSQIERGERTHLHNQPYLKRESRPHQTHVVPTAAGVTTDLAGTYVSYKICQKIDETLFSDRRSSSSSSVGYDRNHDSSRDDHQSHSSANDDDGSDNDKD